MSTEMPKHIIDQMIKFMEPDEKRDFLARIKEAGRCKSSKTTKKTNSSTVSTS